MSTGRTGIALLLVLVCCACSPSSAPHSVSGQKLNYPIQSAAAFDHLGQSMLANCETTNKAVESACMAAMEKRIDSCRISGPVNIVDETAYKIASKKYLACIMPTLICNGIEVTTTEQMRRVCGKPQS